MYPNPNNGIFTLSYNLEKEITEADVVITDVTGKLMYQDKLDIENHNINLKLQNVQSGIYFVQLVNQNNKLLWTDKVIISK